MSPGVFKSSFQKVFMIDLRYLKFAFAAIVVSSLSALALLPSHPQANLWLILLASLFAIPFMSLLVTRLPVFNKFYRQDLSVLDDGFRSSADHKAAAPMAGLVTGAAIALILLPAGVSDIVVPALCGGVGAGVMSFYHQPS